MGKIRGISNQLSLIKRNEVGRKILVLQARGFKMREIRLIMPYSRAYLYRAIADAKSENCDPLLK